MKIFLRICIVILLGAVIVLVYDHSNVKGLVEKQNKSSMAERVSNNLDNSVNSWNFNGRYVLIQTESKSKRDIEMIVKDNKISGKIFNVDPLGNLSWIEISGQINNNNEFFFEQSHYSFDGNGRKVYYEMVASYNGEVVSKDYLAGKMDDYGPISIVSQVAISNYNNHSQDNQQDAQSTVYEDTKGFAKSTADAVKLGWEIMNNPVGSAERIVNDEAYSKNLEKTTEDMIKSADKINKRLDKVSNKLNGLFKDKK